MGEGKSKGMVWFLVLFWISGSLVLGAEAGDEAAKWSRIQSQMKVELGRLGLFPSNPEQPFSGALDGTFYVSELKRDVSVTLPVWERKKDIPEGQNPNQVVSVGSRTHEMPCITVSFRCFALTGNSNFQSYWANMEESYRTYEQRPDRREVQTRKGNIISSETVTTSYRVTAEAKLYHRYRGRSLLLSPMGSIPQLVGFLRVGSFMHHPVYESLAPSRPQRVLGAFPATMPNGETMVVEAVTNGTTQQRPEIQFPHESIIHQALAKGAALISREFEPAPEFVPQSDCAKQEALTRFLNQLRDHHQRLLDLDKDLDVLLRQSQPEARFSVEFGKRIQREGGSWLQTLKEFKNAETRRGLMEELDLIADSLITFNTVSVKYRDLTGRLDTPLSRDQARASRDRVGQLTGDVARHVFAERFESQGLRDILTSRSWDEALNKAVNHSQRKLDEFLDRETDRIFGFGFHDARSAQRALHMQLRREVQRHVAKLLIKITSNELVIELLAAPVVRWLTRDLIPRLREALRVKGNLENRVTRSLETMEEARRSLHALPCNARLRDVKAALAKARGTLNATTYLDGDLRQSRNNLLLSKLGEGTTALTTTINFTSRRFLLNFTDYEEDLDFVIREAGDILREVEGSIPVAGAQNQQPIQSQLQYSPGRQEPLPESPPEGYRQYDDIDDFIPGLQATVASLKFYEGGFGDIPVNQRRYGTTFSQSSARAIWYELNLTHPPQNQQVPFAVQALYWEIQGQGMFRAQNNFSVPAGSGASRYSSGYGWPEAGNWTPGLYRVDIYLNGDKVAHAHFTIQQ